MKKPMATPRSINEINRRHEYETRKRMLRETAQRERPSPLPAWLAIAFFCAALGWLSYEIVYAIAART